MQKMKLKYFTEDESFPFFIQYGQHTEDMPLHEHEDFCELVIVLGGSAVHTVGGCEHFPISKGDVFVIGRDVGHGYEQPSDLRLCNIMFRPETLLAEDYDLKRLPGFHTLFLIDPVISSAEGFGSRLRLSPEEFTEIERLTLRAVGEYSSDKPGKNTLVTALFMEMAVILSRSYGTPEKRPEIAGIAEAAAYMEKNYAEDISSEDIFSVSHYSQRHFVRLFTEAYGTTPQKYLLGIRMRHACALLRESSLNITETALSCGYKDSNYFSRAFRKYVGCTPSEYREG